MVTTASPLDEATFMESANDVVVVVCCASETSSLAAVTFCRRRRRPFLLLFTNAATFATDDSVVSRLSLGEMRCAYFSRSPLPPRDGTGERGVERYRTRDIYLREFVQGNGLRDEKKNWKILVTKY